MIKLFAIFALAISGCGFPEQNANVSSSLFDAEGDDNAVQERPEKRIYRVQLEEESLWCSCSVLKESCDLFEKVEEAELGVESAVNDTGNENEIGCVRTAFSVKKENATDTALNESRNDTSYYIVDKALLNCDCHSNDPSPYIKTLETSGE